MEVPCGGCFCRRSRGKVRAGSGVMYGAVIPGCAGRVSCDAVSYSVRRSGGVSRVPFQSVCVSPGIYSPSVAAPGAALVISARGKVRGGARPPLRALQDSLLRGPGRRRGRTCPLLRSALLPRRPRRFLRCFLLVFLSGAALRPHRRRHACHERALRKQPGIPDDAIVSTRRRPWAPFPHGRAPFLGPDIIRWFSKSTYTKLFHTSFAFVSRPLYMKGFEREKKGRGRRKKKVPTKTERRKGRSPSLARILTTLVTPEVRPPLPPLAVVSRFPRADRSGEDSVSKRNM